MLQESHQNHNHQHHNYAPTPKQQEIREHQHRSLRGWIRMRDAKSHGYDPGLSNDEITKMSLDLGVEIGMGEGGADNTPLLDTTKGMEI